MLYVTSQNLLRLLLGDNDEEFMVSPCYFSYNID